MDRLQDRFNVNEDGLFICNLTKNLFKKTAYEQQEGPNRSLFYEKNPSLTVLLIMGPNNKKELLIFNQKQLHKL